MNFSGIADKVAPAIKQELAARAEGITDGGVDYVMEKSTVSFGTVPQMHISSKAIAARAQRLQKPDNPALGRDRQFADKPMQAVQSADPLVIVTELKAYRSPNWPTLKIVMKAPVIFDWRYLYEPQVMKESSMDYLAIGRGQHA